jgi:hypothetical protein
MPKCFLRLIEEVHRLEFITDPTGYSIEVKRFSSTEDCLMWLRAQERAILLEQDGMRIFWTRDTQGNLDGMLGVMVATKDHV